MATRNHGRDVPEGHVSPLSVHHRRRPGKTHATQLRQRFATGKYRKNHGMPGWVGEAEGRRRGGGGEVVEVISRCVVQSNSMVSLKSLVSLKCSIDLW